MSPERPRPSHLLRLLGLLGLAVVLGAAAPTGDEEIGPIDLSALRGKVVVLEVMETWCGPCKSAIPTLNRWHERFSGAGLYVVAVSPESADALRRYREANNLLAHIAVDEGEAVKRRFEVQAYPTFVVLDRDGEVRGRFRGAGATLAEVEATFTPLVTEPAIPDGIRFGAAGDRSKIE